jgi:hypothetical protein
MVARFALTLLLLTAPLVPAAAQSDDAPGHVAARVFAAAPAPLAFAIEPGDNTDENIALAESLGKEATARGIVIHRTGGALVLRFDTEVRTSEQISRRSFSREGPRLDPDSPTPAPPGARDEVANVLSSRGNAVIGGRPSGGPDYGRLLRYVINATLDDRASGRRLWQGHISYDTSAPDRTQMFVALAPVLAEQIGKSVQEKPFRLD